VVTVLIGLHAAVIDGVRYIKAAVYSGDRSVAVVCIFLVACVHLPISLYCAYTETHKNNYKEFLRL
jgi:hypothetical protein